MIHLKYTNVNKNNDFLELILIDKSTINFFSWITINGQIKINRQKMGILQNIKQLENHFDTFLKWNTTLRPLYTSHNVDLMYK